MSPKPPASQDAPPPPDASAAPDRGPAEASTRRPTGPGAGLDPSRAFADFLQSAVVETMKSRSPDEALRTGLAQVGTDVGWPFGHLWVRDPSLPETLISSGLFHEVDPDRFESFRTVTESSWFGKGRGLPGRVLEEGRAIWIRDITTREDFTRCDAARAAGLRTAFAFPVRVNDQVAAVLELFTTREQAPNPALLDIVERVGSHLGGLVEEAWAREGGISTRSSDFYLAMLESFPFLVWRGGPDGRRNFFNRTWLDFTGRSLEDERGDGWIQAVHPEDRARVARTCARAAAEGAPFTLDYRLRRRDGQTRWMNDVARPFQSQQGKLFGYIGSCYDVTTRYGMVEKLRNHRQRLHVLTHRLMETQESEQRRIARGLHDEIGQLLAGVRMGIESIRSRRHGPEQEQKEVVRSLDMLDQCIRSVRTLALDLRPPDLDHFGLGPAVRSWLDRRTRGTGVSIRLTAPEAPDPAGPGRDVEVAGFRVIQEGVTNALRHSEARTIEVAIRREPDGLVVRVVDDGKGFDRSARRYEAGAGHFGMEERVALLGGELSVETAPGAGTSITARFPLEKRSSNG